MLPQFGATGQAAMTLCCLLGLARAPPIMLTSHLHLSPPLRLMHPVRLRLKLRTPSLSLTRLAPRGVPNAAWIRAIPQWEKMKAMECPSFTRTVRGVGIRRALYARQPRKEQNKRRCFLHRLTRRTARLLSLTGFRQ